MLTHTDKRYIETTIDTKLDHYFDKHIRHHMGLLQDFWKHEFALMMEVIKDKPGREEVREIAREELRHHGLDR